MRFVVIYDACVLYPAPLRDLLMRLALTDLFAARWTDEIHDEWMRNLGAKRPEIASNLERTRELMNKAVPDCLVTGYSSLIQGLELPDADDRHVLAAAIQAGAQLIVTFNLKDFPVKALEPYGIEAVHPDTFVLQQFDLHQGKILAAVLNHRQSLRNPPKTVEDYLDTLASTGLAMTAERLKEFGKVL